MQVMSQCRQDGLVHHRHHRRHVKVSYSTLIVKNGSHNFILGYIECVPKFAELIIEIYQLFYAC